MCVCVCEHLLNGAAVFGEIVALKRVARACLIGDNARTHTTCVDRAEQVQIHVHDVHTLSGGHLSPPHHTRRRRSRRPEQNPNSLLLVSTSARCVLKSAHGFRHGASSLHTTSSLLLSSLSGTSVGHIDFFSALTAAQHRAEQCFRVLV